MYIKNIRITNYGPIADADITASFDLEGKPLPIILIGKNGSGKSIILMNLVDAIIETKRQAFPGGLLEVNNNSYFKVGKKGYIKSRENFSEVDVEIFEGDLTSKYTDIMVRNMDLFKETNKEKYNHFFKNEHDGFSKIIDSKLTAKHFNFSTISYFPIDRYYLPSWYNSANYNKINTQKNERDIDSSNNNIIKYNIFENVREWVYRAFLENTQVATKTKDNSIQIIPIVSQTQERINSILKIILDDQTACIGKVSRFSNDIPIISKSAILNDISSLSSGQMMLFSIFVSIIKDYEYARQLGNRNNNIEGICLIDEVDLNLHISQQLNILPKLFKEFPYVQFIITSHSPFFVKGFKDIFLNGCDIYALPLCKKIDSIYDFSQFKEAEEAFNDSSEILTIKLANQQKQIDKLTSEKNKILLMTEGITDSKYISNAIKKYSFNFDKELMIADDTLNSQGDSKLFDFLTKVALLKEDAPKILALFDSDNPEIVKKFSGSSFYTFCDKKIYGLLLPKPKFRTDGSQFSIEHYFSDSDLSIKNGLYKLYKVEEFNDSGVTFDCSKICKYLVYNKKKHEGHYVLSGSDEQKTLLISDNSNVSLSKNDFCDLCITASGDFSKIDWSNFVELLEFINNNIKLFD